MKDEDKEILKKIGRRATWQIVLLVSLLVVFVVGVLFWAKGIEGLILAAIFLSSFFAFFCLLFVIAIYTNKWRNKMIKKKQDKKIEKWKKEKQQMNKKSQD